MARRRTGSTFEKDGVRQIKIRTDRDDGRDHPKHWTRPCPRNDDGSPMSEIDARKLAQDQQHRYDRGEWDPWAVVAPAAAPAASSAPDTFAAYVEAWVGGQHYEAAPKDLRSVRRHLAGSPLATVPVRQLRPRHGVQLLGYLRGRPSTRGGTLGSNIVSSVFNVCQRAIDQAVMDEFLPANPLRLRAVHKHLPEKTEKVPGARAAKRFTDVERDALTTDPRIESDRRVFYALLFWTGMRPGELRALRVRDLHLDERPLGRIVLARAIKSESGAEGETKTGASKEVPILPPLARVLAAWLGAGWQACMGRAPGADDLLVPSVRGRHKGQPRNASTAARTFLGDQTALDFPRTLQLYATRHTLVRMLRDAGASRDVVRWATHAPPKSVYDGYADAPPWDVLCKEFSKLQGASLAASLATATATNDVAARRISNVVRGAWRKHRRIELSQRAAEGCKALRFSLASRGMEGASRALGGPLATPLATLRSRSLGSTAEAYAACESALWGWHDRALLAELESAGEPTATRERDA